MIEFSYFNHFFSNQPNRCEVADWGELVDKLKAISEVDGYKPAAGDFESVSSGLISPAIYSAEGQASEVEEEREKRCNENVIGWDIVCMDIDDGITDISVVQNHFAPFTNIIYSSPNCTAKKLKVRVIIPLKSRCPRRSLKQLWFAMNEWCNGVIDRQTKDASRLFYIPARYTNRGDEYLHFFVVNDGMDLDWEALIERYPSPPEKDLFKKDSPLLGLKRKIYMQSKKPPSMHIMDHNCPFVDKSMRDDYLMTPIGGHHYAIYKFLLRVCYKAKDIDYPLSIDELVDMGKQMDDLDGGYYDEKKLYDSAGDALEYTSMI